MKYIQQLIRQFLHTRDIVLLALIQLFCAAKDLGGVFSLAYATDQVLAGQRVAWAFVIMGVVMVVGVGIASVDTYYRERLLLKVRRQVMSAYGTKLMTLRLDAVEALEMGQVLNTYSGDIQKICYWFQWVLPKIFNLAFYLVGALAYSFFHNAALTLSVAPAVMIIVPVLSIIVKRLGASVQKERSMADQIAKKVSEIFQGNETIKTFNIAPAMEEKTDPLLQKKESQDFRSAMYKGLARSISFLISYVPGILAGLVGGYYMLRGFITVGFLIAFIQMMMGRIAYSFPQFSDYITATREAGVYSERILSFLTLPNETRSGNTTPAYAVDPLIEFKHVSFAYPEREPILRDLSLTVKTGQMVSFVGLSGCGKSTILKLIMGYYPDQYEGSITIAGVELRDWNPEELRKNMAPLFQDSFLFSGTVRDNLAMTDQHGALSRIASQFQFTDAFLDTQVGEAGVRVSGGQRQQIALARGELKQAPLYLLDEPLANLDSVTENRIWTQAKAILAGRTVLLVEHRLEAVKDSDCIYYIENGTAVEQGTHAQLLERGGAYAALYQKQTREGGATA